MRRTLFLLAAVLVAAVMVFAPFIRAEEKFFLPAALGWQGEPFAEGSTERVLRLSLMDRSKDSGYVRSGKFYFFGVSGPRSLYLDFGEGQWGTGEAYFPSFQRGGVVTFTLRNRANGPGFFPTNPGPMENLLVSVETQPTIAFHGWVETWQVKGRWGYPQLVERRIVIQPLMFPTTETALPVFVTGDEDTEFFLSNPTDQPVHLVLEIENLFPYYDGLGRQGERVFSPRVFRKEMVLSAWEIRRERTSAFLGMSWDSQGNPLTEGVLRVRASAPILAKIE